MRISVVGGGIAGMLLAWRLVRQPGLRVDLIAGPEAVGDATRASGGLVRAFEIDPALASLAQLSLRELRASALLREWSGYRETGSLYLLDGPARPHRVSELQEQLPDSVELLTSRQIADRYGFAGLPASTEAILERQAGFFSPELLRQNALADFTARGGQLDRGVLRAVRPRADSVAYRTDQGWSQADALVLAAGAWSGRLLRDCGLPPAGLRTKVIQYAVYEVEGERPPAFLDDTTGLYGRPAGPGRMLLGRPTERWDVDPGPQPFMDREELAVRRTAAELLPGLRIRPPHRFIAVAEAYGPQGRLLLRPVPVPTGHLFTYTGGSGAADKTALAAPETVRPPTLFTRM
ncbi:FAD-binding oxidoreductase, partial [Kitasatospora nipponensis]|uniref:NAD(P)/FAD-dependent oxidoreductase n=1 Tax=Kitasatospora nipponensis TaxID=258049 RepID=UPI0031DF7428